MTMKPAFAKTEILSELDDILNGIGLKLQISPTAHEEACKRYDTITEWLNKEDSPLARFSPEIYSQGSLRIGTTVKPKGEEEFDVDLVCVLNTSPEQFPNPIDLLKMIEARLRANGIYEGMIEPKNRCVRINYANEFHMDILPACPNPSHFEFHGTHCLIVPDRNLKDWKDSNPKGYALWFEEKAKKAAAKFRKSIEPLPEQQTYEELETLQRVVQLMKRHRDIALEDLDPIERPISIVLTTLAARAYDGSASVIDALETILFSIKLNIQLNAAAGRQIVVPNPTNKAEILSERWEKDPKLYATFAKWIDDFNSYIRQLRETTGFPEKADLLKRMFGEKVTTKVVEDYFKNLTELRKEGRLATAFTTGLIVPKETPKSTPVPYNNFHGDE